jgi:hypothetical protein
MAGTNHDDVDLFHIHPLFHVKQPVLYPPQAPGVAVPAPWLSFAKAPKGDT